MKKDTIKNQTVKDTIKNQKKFSDTNLSYFQLTFERLVTTKHTLKIFDKCLKILRTISLKGWAACGARAS